MDESFWSRKRLFYACLSWLYFVIRGINRYPLWQYVRYWRRQDAAARDDTTFFVS